MTKEQLIGALTVLRRLNDPEQAHGLAEDLLLDYIKDEDVTAAFKTLTRWYA